MLKIDSMIVCKFGGSSLANSDGFRNAARIMLNSDKRRVMVLSAPGKHQDSGKKITDALFGIVKKNQLGRDFSKMRDTVLDQLRNIESGLLGSESISKTLLDTFEERLGMGPAYVVSMGEEFSCAAMVEYLKKMGISVGVFNPIDLLVEVNGNGRVYVPPAAYPKIQRVLSDLMKKYKIVCAPGFFGTDAEGKRHLFSRGGSDYTAVVLAAALSAECCEKFSDVDGVMDANPRIFEHAQLIPQLTYDGFIEIVKNSRSSPFHLDALKVARDAGLCLRIVNSFNPDAEGTIVGSSK